MAAEIIILSQPGRGPAMRDARRRVRAASGHKVTVSS